MNICFPLGFGPCNEKQWVDSGNTDEELIKREEKRIREFFEFLDDAEFLENMRCKRLNYPRKHEIHLQDRVPISFNVLVVVFCQVFCPIPT